MSNESAFKPLFGITGNEYVKKRKEFIDSLAWAITLQVDRGRNLDEVLDSALKLLAIEVREEVEERISI